MDEQNMLDGLVREWETEGRWMDRGRWTRAKNGTLEYLPTKRQCLFQSVSFAPRSLATVGLVPAGRCLTATKGHEFLISPPSALCRRGGDSRLGTTGARK